MIKQHHEKVNSRDWATSDRLLWLARIKRLAISALAIDGVERCRTDAAPREAVRVRAQPEMVWIRREQKRMRDRSEGRETDEGTKVKGDVVKTARGIEGRERERREFRRTQIVWNNQVLEGMSKDKMSQICLRRPSIHIPPQR
jgi:hypothetical protein